MSIVLSPLTKTNNVSLLREYPSELLISSWKNKFNIDIHEELSKVSNVYLYRCNDTGLKFFSPPQLAGSDRLYSQLEKFNWFYMSDKWEFKIALACLKDCCKILEIGSAFGSFIRLGLDSGYDIEGIELNKSAVKIAKENNLPVECITLEKHAERNGQRYDAVCSFQVLEHVPDPENFIHHSLNVLKRNGKLIFCVPNNDSFLKHSHNILDMPPHHMTQWSLPTFKALERIFPIKLEKFHFEPLPEYHVEDYLNTYGQYFNSISSVFRVFFNRFTLPVTNVLLKTYFRKYFKGQSILVQFTKL